MLTRGLNLMIAVATNAIREQSDTLLFNPSKIASGLTREILACFRENELPYKETVGTGADEVFRPEKLHQLVNTVIKQPGGDGDYSQRRTAVINGLESILAAANASNFALGDFILAMNLIPKFFKGATKTNGFYQEFEQLGQKPLLSLTLLPIGALYHLVLFIMEKENWN